MEAARALGCAGCDRALASLRPPDRMDWESLRRIFDAFSLDHYVWAPARAVVFLTRSILSNRGSRRRKAAVC